MELPLILSLALCCIETINSFVIPLSEDSFMALPGLQFQAPPENSEDSKPLTLPIHEHYTSASHFNNQNSNLDFQQLWNRILRASQGPPQIEHAPQPLAPALPAKFEHENGWTTHINNNKHSDEHPSVADELKNLVPNEIFTNQVGPTLPGKHHAYFKKYQYQVVKGPHGEKKSRELTIGEDNNGKVTFQIFAE